MKSRIQLQVAKHMIAVWLKPNDPDALKGAYWTIDQCWPGLARRVLRTWAKALVKNPERYEFTGFGYRKLDMQDYFSNYEIQAIVEIVDKMPDITLEQKRGMYRSITHHKYMYGMDTPSAIQAGIGIYWGCSPRTFRPAKPVLKALK
jgi:hypothetical protein